ncbi:MAG: Trk system potassium transporter TrkA, partial [Myxococcota bacterium]
MKIVIVGMGEVGKHIAKVLLDETHDVVIIDQDEGALNSAEERFDAMILQGHGGSIATLREAGIDSCDLFIAVTNNDEVNMISAIRAKQLGAKQTIARVSNEVYFDDERGLHRSTFGHIDLVINPKVLVAIEIHKLVRTAAAVAVEDFADNRIEMVQLPVDESSTTLNRPLRDLSLPNNTLIAAIERSGELIVPSGADKLLPGDEVLCVGRVEQIPQVERLFNRERKRFVHKVFIVGGSEIGEHLARTLDADGVHVVLVEQDRERCYELADQLGDNVTVLNGDGTNMTLLEEERIDRADVFIAASAHDEVNLMASLLAKDLGVRRSIA